MLFDNYNYILDEKALQVGLFLRSWFRWPNPGSGYVRPQIYRRDHVSRLLSSRGGSVVQPDR